MNSRYGKVQRSISTVSWNLSASARKPGAKSSTSSGAATTPTIVTTVRNQASVPAAPSTSSRTSAALRARVSVA